MPLFSDLEQDELERFSRVAVPRSFPAGDPRLPRGRPLRRLLHRPRRAASASPASTPTGGRSPSRRSARATSSASWRCSTARSARPASKSLDDGELLALPAGEVRALLARHPEITVKLVAALVRRLRDRQRADLPPVLPDRPEPRRRRPHPARRRGGAARRRRRRGDDPDEPGRPRPARRHLARERQPLPRRPRARRRRPPRPRPGHRARARRSSATTSSEPKAPLPPGPVRGRRA